MLKPVAVAALAFVPLFATSAHADTVTTEADTLVVVTPNAPIVVNQGGPAPVASYGQGPGAAEMPPPPPPPPPPAAAAPQNEAWSNVSHINGTPVKVGERGDYLHKFKKTNISLNPFGLFFGWYDLNISHALSNNIAASVSIGGMDEGYAFQLSATLPIYLRRTYSGPFLEPGLLIRTNETYNYDGYSDSMSTETWTGPQLMAGWHWTFDSGLNMAFAFGVAKPLNNGGDDYYDDDPEANGYIRFGYAF